MTWYEYLRTMPPSKLAVFFRKKLAHNQGCPPASLMQVYTLCAHNRSCDDCWWAWLLTERRDKKGNKVDPHPEKRCWVCRWGARAEAGGHNVVACMNPKFYGAIMGEDEFCSNFDERYWDEDSQDVPEDDPQPGWETLTKEEAEDVKKELKRRREIKQIRKELHRRQLEREAKENAELESMDAELQREEDRGV